MQFYILMIDYGRDTSKAVHGFAANVEPEFSRSDILDQVRDVLASDDKTVAFVKRVDGNYIEDVTDEFTHCAVWGDHETPDRQAANWDRQRDYRKHEVA